MNFLRNHVILNMSSSEMSTSRSFISPRAHTPRSRHTHSEEEIPVHDVQDTNCYSTETYSGVTGTGTGDSENNSIANSLLDKIEETVLKNASQEIKRSNDGSVQSLDSSIKFFKMTVEKIFETYYVNLQDIEMYKKRFNDILEKRAYSVMEMEEFIKDMLNDIVSSEISVTSDSRKELKSLETNTTTTSMSGEHLIENLHSVVEAYKNDNYMTDSTLDENTSKGFKAKREIFNVYLLNTTPNVQIRVKDRSVLSEIIIKDENSSAESKVASAENIRKLRAKKIELETRERNVDCSSSDREIPVKTSSARKNIHSSKECASELSSTPERNENKSFMSKICNYLCKRLRKTFG